MKELQTVTLGDCKAVSAAIEICSWFSADAMIEGAAPVGKRDIKGQVQGQTLNFPALHKGLLIARKADPSLAYEKCQDLPFGQ